MQNQEIGGQLVRCMWGEIRQGTGGIPTTSQQERTGPEDTSEEYHLSMIPSTAKRPRDEPEDERKEWIRKNLENLNNLEKSQFVKLKDKNEKFLKNQIYKLFQDRH